MSFFLISGLSNFTKRSKRSFDILKTLEIWQDHYTTDELLRKYSVDDPWSTGEAPFSSFSFATITKEAHHHDTNPSRNWMICFPSVWMFQMKRFSTNQFHKIDFLNKVSPVYVWQRQEACTLEEYATSNWQHTISNINLNHTSQTDATWYRYCLLGAICVVKDTTKYRLIVGVI